jgi:hypothetical protein
MSGKKAGLTTGATKAMMNHWMREIAMKKALTLMKRRVSEI